MRRIASLLLIPLAALGCHHDVDPVPPAHPVLADMPPLPPSSGTPVGYLLDAATDLHLRDEQVGKLKEIDSSLAAQQAEIDTQLRAIERPDEEQAKQAQEEHRHHNNAPGQGIHTTADAGRLHEVRDRNDHEALDRAFALLDSDQKAAAKKLLEDRGVRAPGSTPEKHQPTGDDGEPIPGEP